MMVNTEIDFVPVNILVFPQQINIGNVSCNYKFRFKFLVIVTCSHEIISFGYFIRTNYSCSFAQIFKNVVKSSSGASTVSVGTLMDQYISVTAVLQHFGGFIKIYFHKSPPVNTRISLPFKDFVKQSKSSKLFIYFGAVFNGIIGYELKFRTFFS